jgi:hypothetical protein
MDAPSEAEDDHIRVSFTVTEEGDYKVWGRVVTPGSDANSFWVKMDESEWVLWEGIHVGSDWFWDDVHDGENSNPMVYELDSGEHTLQICYREYGARLDKMLITNRGHGAIGLGGEAEGCSFVGVEPEIEEGKWKIYPNPVNDYSILHLNTDQTCIPELRVYNSMGQLVFKDRIQNQTYPLGSRLLSPGVYFYIVRNEKEIISQGKLIR